MLKFEPLRRGVHVDDVVGFIPMFADEQDPKSIHDQFNINYAHGGGWHPIDGFELIDKELMTLKFPGDPPLQPLVFAKFRDHHIVYVYESGIVMIYDTQDGTFEVARMD